MRALLLLLLLTLPAAAETVQFTILTEPPGAMVYLEVSGKEPLFVGLSGQPMVLDSARLQASSVLMTLRLEGYHSKNVRISSGLLKHDPHRWPADGRPEPLVASSALVPLQRFVRQNALLVGVLVMLGAAGLWVAGRRWARIRARLKREEVLQQFQARLDLTDPRIMALVGEYRLIEKLGAGGMSTVYKAVPDGTLDESRAVAVKIMLPDLASDEVYAGRFRREVRLTRQLHHPAIVRVYDYGDQEGLLYLVMELVQGELLRKRILSMGGIPLEEAWGYLKQILQGVAHAHQKGVVHRDLKPENVMLTRDGKVKIMDFGLARAEQSTGRLTRTGTSVGTPYYMPPEQFMRAEPDAGMDQYALGVLGYEMLSGEVPFEDAADPQELFFLKFNRPVRPIRQVKPDLPEGVERALTRMMAVDPQDRFPSVHHAMVALEAAIGRS